MDRMRRRRRDNDCSSSDNNNANGNGSDDSDDSDGATTTTTSTSVMMAAAEATAAALAARAAGNAVDADENDTLICGFGPRGGRQRRYGSGGSSFSSDNYSSNYSSSVGTINISISGELDPLDRDRDSDRNGGELGTTTTLQPRSADDCSNNSNDHEYYQHINHNHISHNNRSNMIGNNSPNDSHEWLRQHSAATSLICGFGNQDATSASNEDEDNDQDNAYRDFKLIQQQNPHQHHLHHHLHHPQHHHYHQFIERQPRRQQPQQQHQESIGHWDANINMKMMHPNYKPVGTSTTTHRLSRPAAAAAAAAAAVAPALTRTSNNGGTNVSLSSQDASKPPTSPTRHDLNNEGNDYYRFRLRPVSVLTKTGDDNNNSGNNINNHNKSGSFSSSDHGGSGSSSGGGGEGGGGPNVKRSVSRSSSIMSYTSEGDVSMASENAVVLMLNLLVEEEDEAEREKEEQQEQQKNRIEKERADHIGDIIGIETMAPRTKKPLRRRFTHQETNHQQVVGRIYKHEQNCDNESIPEELQLLFGHHDSKNDRKTWNSPMTTTSTTMTTPSPSFSITTTMKKSPMAMAASSRGLEPEARTGVGRGSAEEVTRTIREHEVRRSMTEQHQQQNHQLQQQQQQQEQLSSLLESHRQQPQQHRTMLNDDAGMVTKGGLHPPSPPLLSHQEKNQQGNTKAAAETTVLPTKSTTSQYHKSPSSSMSPPLPHSSSHTNHYSSKYTTPAVENEGVRKMNSGGQATSVTLSSSSSFQSHSNDSHPHPYNHHHRNQQHNMHADPNLHVIKEDSDDNDDSISDHRLHQKTKYGGEEDTPCSSSSSSLSSRGNNAVQLKEGGKEHVRWGNNVDDGMLDYIPSSSSSLSFKDGGGKVQSTKSKKSHREEGRRAIVSRNSETEYVKVIVPKPDSVKKLIYDAIAANILFKACSHEELTELVQVFAPSEASAGSTVIQEGDEGDAFYVMERGIVDVYEQNEHKATLYSPVSFGEIALLYGCPRSATLRTRYFCKLWFISRAAFRAITSKFKQRRMESKVEFLKKVKIRDKFLSDVLSESELNTLALATLHESYEAGHVIIREGEPGDIFYMIDSGSVDIVIAARGDAPVATLSSGQFFGELALLSKCVRTASCIAKTDVKCHILMRNDFNLLLGDLQSLMEGGDYRRREDEFVQPNLSSSLQVDLADLDILKVLGIGAFGRVRLAKLKRPVEAFKNDDVYFALKIISKQSLKDHGLDVHIMNEKNILSSLDHPCINRFYCDMEDDKHLYFLLEALPGGELCKRLREVKQFPEPWGKFYSASVLFAFCYLHAKKIAYRDLKPENLVMDSIGYVKLVDFGLAKVIERGKTWTLCGTPAYLAPEIVLNDGHDWAVDYWSLGVFLFEMTSGREPFAAKNPMEVYKQIVSGHVEIPSYFSPSLTDLIMKLLNTSKSKRLGRTMGGGGAVMQHGWYSDFDWDAHLEKRLEVPLQPKTQEILSEDSVTSSIPSKTAGSSQSKQPQNKVGTRPKEPPRLTYSLGQGNRHHQKLLEMIDSGGHNESDYQADSVRMTMMRVIKQQERWSRVTRESSNSSTRNTTLGVGQQMSTRSSVITEESDAFLRLQLMHLSLAAKRFSLSAEKDRAYQQFSLLSLCSSSVKRGKCDLRPCGYHFLDPFVTKKIDVLDRFPQGLSESDINAEALAAFCFPNGLKIRLIPRCAIEGAKRLGWLGVKGDTYQVQGFTDVAGSLNHGCTVTTREVVTHSDARDILSAVALARAWRRSAAVIARWWLNHLRQPVHSRSGPNLNSKPKGTRASSMVEKASAMKWGRKVGDDEVHRMGEERSSATILRAAVDKVIAVNMFKSASVGDLAFDEGNTAVDHTTGQERDEEDNTPVPEHIRLLGISAYQAMVEAVNEGDVCIVEKSYVLTGTKLQDTSLFFCALQNLIDMERKFDENSGSMTSFKRRSMTNGVESRSNDQHRHAILSALQSNLSLTPVQRRVMHPRNEFSYVSSPQRRFVMDLSIPGFSKISLPLPLPKVSGEWGLSTLFLRIKDSGLLILLKLLLLERSVLLVGETSEEVTACSTALLELLHPYKWASAFMPLLPSDMLDFVSSPVPFIAGMIVDGKQHLHNIIHDYGVKDAMLQGLSIVNLVSGKLIVTREQGTSDMLRRSFQTIPELTLYHKRLEEYCKSPASNLLSFKKFCKYGASRKESLTLQKIKDVIKKHLSTFTIGLNDKSDAWQQYGEFNKTTGTFDFCPNKFIEPLKDRMIFQIQFQEMMAHTQLFVGYVEELQLAHEKRIALLSGRHAKFIAQWVELHWHAKFGR